MYLSFKKTIHYIVACCSLNSHSSFLCCLLFLSVFISFITILLICDFYDSFFPCFNLEHPPNLSSLAFWNSCLFDLWMWDLLTESFILKFRILPCIPSCLPRMVCVPTAWVPQRCSAVLLHPQFQLQAPRSACFTSASSLLPLSIDSLCSCFSLLNNTGKGSLARRLLWEKSTFYSHFAVSLIWKLWSLPFIFCSCIYQL